MKRFVILMVVLLLLGGVAFYFGWVQIHIPAGHYGVIFTRTNGWEDEPVVPGTFVWRWQRLVPTNFTLYLFDVESHRTEVRLDGTLPSGPEIDTLLDDAGDFAYDVRLTVVTRLTADEVPRLARDQELRPDGMETFYDDLDARIAQQATEAVMGVIEDEPQSLSVSQISGTIVDAVRERLSAEFPRLEIVSVTPRRLELPDLQLYTTARRLSIDVLEARASALQEAATRLADIQAESDRGLSMLERYGQILKEYPVLLDYFRVGQEIGSDPLNLEEIVPRTSQ